MKPFRFLIFLLFALPGLIAVADDLAAWKPGLAGGEIVPRSISPNKQWALFEIYRYDRGMPTTASAIAVASADRSLLIGLLHGCRTKHETDLPYKSYLTTLWSPNSVYLAVHDSTPKNSQLRLYRVADSKLEEIKLPDLLTTAQAQLHREKQKIGHSGQMPIAWPTPNTLIVAVRIYLDGTPHETQLQLKISPEAKVTIERAVSEKP